MTENLEETNVKSVRDLYLSCFTAWMSKHKHWTWNDRLAMKGSDLSNYLHWQWDELFDMTAVVWEPPVPAETLHTPHEYKLTTLQLFTLLHITSPSASRNTPVYTQTLWKRLQRQYEGHLWNKSTDFSPSFIRIAASQIPNPQRFRYLWLGCSDI